MLVYKYEYKIRLNYILISIHKMSKRVTFTDEFKTMITELVLSGKTVREVCS